MSSMEVNWLGSNIFLTVVLLLTLVLIDLKGVGVVNALTLFGDERSTRSADAMAVTLHMMTM